MRPVLACLPLFLPVPALAQTGQLYASDPGSSDHFGQAVAIGGHVCVVGSPFDDDNGSQSGSAYLFDMNAGVQTAKLLASDGVAQDAFGSAVGIGGEWAIVGAPQHDPNGTNCGAVYVFDKTTGVQISMIWPSDGAFGDGFGYSVALSGNIAIIGSPWDDDAGTTTGAAYLFDIATGTQLAKLGASDAGQGDGFGYSVAIDGTTAIVGARWNDDQGGNSGAAYLFDVASATQTAKLLPSDGAADDWFGFSVGVHGQAAIVGAPTKDDLGYASGGAYLFNVSTGLQTAKLLASDGTTGNLFGWSVSTSGTRSLVGSHENLNSLGGTGAAYVYDANSGAQITKLVPNDSGLGDSFGISVAINGDTGVIGAHDDGDSGYQSGAAYLFNTPNPADNSGNAYCFGDGSGATCPCGLNGNLGAGCANNSGLGAKLTGMGNATTSLDTFQLQVTGVWGSKPGLLLSGDNQVATPMGDGILCTSGNLQLSQVQITGGGGTTYTNFHGASLGTIANLGTATNFQYWYRDLGVSCSGTRFNYSNAWSVIYQP